jgi:hypothetical protein
VRLAAALWAAIVSPSIAWGESSPEGLLYRSNCAPSSRSFH